MDQLLIPGSEWLYFKIYTGKKSADNILVHIIQPFVESLLAYKDISEYFFIRYLDPNFHLRLRLKLVSKQSFNPVMNEFYKYFNAAIQNGLILKIQLDTYERELERYGTTTMEGIESLFYIDSYSILNFLKSLKGNGDSDTDRWLIAMNFIDDTLTAFNLNLKQKNEFIEYVTDNFKKEFGINTKSIKSLDNKYRANRTQIEEILKHEGIIYNQYRNILNLRQSNLSLIFEKIKNINEIIISYTLPSLTHMTLNRLFRDKSRMYEMSIYYLMSKYYYSELCKFKKGVYY